MHKNYTYECVNKDTCKYWQCPNMKDKEGDLDMEYERYECKVCGLSYKLDYEDIK